MIIMPQAPDLRLTELGIPYGVHSSNSRIPRVQRVRRSRVMESAAPHFVRLGPGTKK
jgi:hypothetical protein